MEPLRIEVSIKADESLIRLITMLEEESHPLVSVPKKKTAPTPTGSDVTTKKEEAPVASEPEAVQRDLLKIYCAKRKAEGVNIAEIIKNLGYEKFSKVPDDKLSDLEEAVKKA